MRCAVIVFDASTLILLSKIEMLREVLAGMDVIIPKVIEVEATRQANRPDAQLISRCIEEGMIRVRDPKEIKRADLNKLMRDFHLSEGEATALLLAQRWNGPLATDDGPAIKACKVFGIPVVTAVNLLVQAALTETVSKDTALTKLELLYRVGRYEIRIVEHARKRIQGG